MQPFFRNVRGASWADLLKKREWRTPHMRRFVSALMALVLLVSAIGISAWPQVTNASYANVLTNGGFESGFSSQAGCGSVGNGWNCFTNGGATNYGYYDDQWDPVVAEGEHSQLIEINTKGIGAPDADRYAGIYQTVRVVDWAEYTLSLRGMIRTTVKDGDPYRYSVQVGWTAGPHPNWTAVSNWQNVGWNTYYDRLSPGAMNSFDTHLMAEDDYITVYVRVWKKWGVSNEEIDINLDAISLTGPAVYYHDYAPPVAVPLPAQPPVAQHPVVLPGEPLPPNHPTTLPAYPVHPIAPPVDTGMCSADDMVYNGGFEQGFNPVYVGHVGKGWGFFTNGGAANYGFYDDQWPPVVAEGKSSQLIEINTKKVYPADGDRYAGIYQQIGYLHPGKTYELTVKGMLRGAGDDTDPYRFMAQWGFNADGDVDWTHVTNWQTVDLGKIQPRTNPGNIVTYRVRFTAPADSMVLFLRGWSKWGTPDIEFDLNLDGISVRKCGGGHPPVHPPVQPPVQPGVCVYTVQPGDTLSGIAAQYGVTVHELMQINNITNPNIIFVGQQILIPVCGGAGHPPVVVPPIYPPVEPPAQQTYVVQMGDTLSGIAAMFGVTTWDLAYCNGIANPDFIYVGQILKIP